MFYNFIEKTNFCERKGFTFFFKREKGFVKCDLYKNGVLIKKGVKKYKNCLDAQKQSYDKLFMIIKNKE